MKPCENSKRNETVKKIVSKITSSLSIIKSEGCVTYFVPSGLKRTEFAAVSSSIELCAQYEARNYKNFNHQKEKRHEILNTLFFSVW
jgi:hypothetical protein